MKGRATAIAAALIVVGAFGGFVTMRAAAASYEATPDTSPASTVPASTVAASVPAEASVTSVAGTSIVPAATVATVATADTAVSSQAPDGATPESSTPGIVEGPSMSIDAAEMAPGGRVIVTLDQFESIWATVTVCGNEARRGSPDCNQTASVTKEFPIDGSPLRMSIPIVAPPTDCPCVLRAVGRDTSEIAIAPIVITGHPVGPVVEPQVTGPLLTVAIEAGLGASGAIGGIRAQLGGPATYEVTVRVTNTSTSGLRDVQLSATATRGADIVASLPFDDPGQIGVGQTWSQSVVAEVPAPSFGDVEWRVVASGAGPTVTDELTTTHRPWLLIGVVLLVVFNIGVLLMRWRVRRRVERGELVDREMPSERPAVGAAAPGAAASAASEDAFAVAGRR
ncbi:MAG: hypothetical protein KDB40_11890 [Acidimicrobiales bacterium]|nr:hypothetical protein [Acidimicrobiales bacterium]MCB9395306.1 hypothetical protein [Acidimicrobiaceae bacterium]